MISLNNISRVYFIGIGGIGMSALARFFNLKGCAVSGYDKVRTPLTEELEGMGISIHYDIDIEKVDKRAELIIYTPAIPDRHEELSFFKDNEYVVLKRSEALEEVLKTYKTIAVAGTHGKTTVSSISTFLLDRCGVDITAFIGGIATNYESNFVYAEGEYALAEADEYDRSFLRMNPSIAIITAMDADHLDIYGDHEELKRTFRAFSRRLKEDGLLIYNYGLDLTENDNLEPNKNTLTYHLKDRNADYHTTEIEIRSGQFYFNAQTPKGEMTELTIRQPGYHNVENALAAIALAQYLKVDNASIKMALADFKGIKRRFEYLHDSDNLVMIDDYAHHPKEVEVFLHSVKEMYPDRKVTAVFQPHLYSRTHDFYLGFAESLSLADELILLDIYPAREEPMEGVSSELIFDSVDLEEKYLIDKTELLQHIQHNDYDVFCTVGAGDIDLMLHEIKLTLTEKEKNLNKSN